MNAQLNQLVQRNRFLLALARIVVLLRDRCHQKMWAMNRSGAVKRYLECHKVRKLQLGAGTNILEGWLNSDIYPSARGVVYIDAKRVFPFKSGTFDYVFSEHQIEHLTYNEGRSMVRECYRVMKPGGKIRIATPNLETFVALYTPKNNDIQQRYIRWVVDKFLSQIGIYRAAFVINNAFFNCGHQFIYDRETLQSILEDVGFIEMLYYLPGESNTPVFQGIESHGKSVGSEEMNRFETMVLEARRP